jgi:hypothetical protein
MQVAVVVAAKQILAAVTKQVATAAAEKDAAAVNRFLLLRLLNKLHQYRSCSKQLGPLASIRPPTAMARRTPAQIRPAAVIPTHPCMWICYPTAADRAPYKQCSCVEAGVGLLEPES